MKYILCFVVVLMLLVVTFTMSASQVEDPPQDCSVSWLTCFYWTPVPYIPETASPYPYPYPYPEPEATAGPAYPWPEPIPISESIWR